MYTQGTSKPRPDPRTPAMAAGLTDHVWAIEEIVSLAKNCQCGG